jgi:uncharacterized membrane protein
MLAIALTLIPAPCAYAVTEELPAGLSTTAGALALVAAAFLLREMLALRSVARGAAIADNVSYVVLAAMCLAASVLVGWIARFVPSGFSTEHARLGADLLSIVGMVLFAIYFARVRLVMKRYVRDLAGEQQLLASVMDIEDGS